MEQTCDGVLTVAYGLGGGTGAGQSVTYTRMGAVVRFTFGDLPIRVGSVAKTGPETLSIDDGELVMSREVSAALESRGAACSGDSDWTPYEAAGLGQVPTTDIGGAGIIDHGCVAEAHQMIPWGSQYRNQVSRESHAWVLAALDRDLQMQEAIASAERS